MALLIALSHVVAWEQRMANKEFPVLERIWFIKPNLRLRSTTAIAMDGTPLQARFCSEIRRVSSPQH